MRTFGLVLATAALTALIGTVWAFTDGSPDIVQQHWSNPGVP
jgi:hypothetical protein